MSFLEDIFLIYFIFVCCLVTCLIKTLSFIIKVVLTTIIIFKY